MDDEDGEAGVGLHVHRSERADALVGPLADLLSTPPEDPFTPDVVAVPTHGVERWLAQRLSHRLGATADEAGICANVDFPSPARLVAQVLADVDDRADDPWDPDRLVWPVLDVLDAVVTEPGFEALAQYVGHDDDPGSHRRSRRYGVARGLAASFTSYASQRPDLLGEWATGGSGGVSADLAWQPELWRRVRAAIGTPSPAERLQGVVARLADGTAECRLPLRLSVFGPTRLPEDQLRVLTATARHREVHLWLMHPSPVQWARGGTAPGPRRADRPVDPATHPLLASLGRDADELRLRLVALGPQDDVHHPLPDRPSTLLGRLQTQLRDDAAPDEPTPAAPGDRSVQVHACHGRARQVEVLREVLLQVLAADPTLEPRDVLVMCPDIEAFAPLVSATFGLATEGEDDGADGAADRVHPGHRLRVRLADRSLRQTNPVLDVVAQLLHLADGRVTASEVLDLLASPPLRRRFGFDDDDLDRLREWTVDSRTRWGEDMSRREQFHLGGVGQGTWLGGLDRVLLGAAMADEAQRRLGTALPLDDVDSVDVDLAGRFAEAVDRLGRVLAALQQERPLRSWLEALDHALDLLVDTTPALAWQLVQARRVLGDVRLAEHEAAGSTADAARPARLADVRALLANRLEGRPTRANFRTGNLTMCSLVPMRSVPHRVVVLLGMDDGAFPRGSSTDGDDVLLRDPLLGERDRRSEDRQLFLDAVLAAGEHLVVLHSGADERTGARRPPAVPVGELLDALDRTAVAPGGAPVRDLVVVRHPLQPFDSRNFVAGALGVPGPASFDRSSRDAAVVAAGPRVEPGPFLTDPLPGAELEAELDLEELVRFFEHPTRALVRRVGVTVPWDDDEVDDRLPLALSSLEAWDVGERTLQARVDGADADRARTAEVLRGTLPPGAIGAATLSGVSGKVEALLARWTAAGLPEPSGVDVLVDLPDGRTLSGTLPVRGRVLARATYSRLAAKHRLRAWVQLVALAATRPDEAWQALTVGRPESSRDQVAASVLQAPAEARAVLETLVRLRDRGLTEPLPMPPKTAATYAQHRRRGRSPELSMTLAATEWQGSTFPERDDHYYRMVWGSTDLADLAQTRAPGSEPWPGEPTRLGELAATVWGPLLAHEEVSTT